MPAPDQAPAGVILKFLPRPSNVLGWTDWLAANPPPMTAWESRPTIRPRMLLVHTNAASGPGTKDSAYNWAMAAHDNTKPHYQVDRDGSAYKFLPSDRRGIANYQADAFALSIETADLGYGPDRPGGNVGFTTDQGETVAQIIAYESELWDFPIEYPAYWNGEGVGCHTEPFGYPWWTKYTGKTCPGEQKKLDMVAWIMPRAREIRYGTTPTPIPQPQPEEDMASLFIGVEGSPGQYLWTPGAKPIPFTDPRQRDLLLAALGIDPANGVTLSPEMFARLS